MTAKRPEGGASTLGEQRKRTTYLGSSRRRSPACGQTLARYFPPGCPASRPAAEPGSAGQWARCGASPRSASAGPARPDGREMENGCDTNLQADCRMPLQTPHDFTHLAIYHPGPYHQLLVNDHLADDGVHGGEVQFKHVRQCLHAVDKEGRKQGAIRSFDYKAGAPVPPQGPSYLMES